MTLTYRRTKGSQLTSAEADGNVDHLLQSSNLSFLQSGTTAFTGATTRTVSQKLREIVSLTDFEDASGNKAGPSATAATNTTAFNRALATGRAVYVPGVDWVGGEKYNLNALAQITASSVVYGEGYSSLLAFNTTGAGFDVNHTSPAGSVRSVFRDLAFINVTNTPSAFILNTNSVNLLVERCFFANAAATYCIDNKKGYGFKARHCNFYNITGTGLRLQDDGAGGATAYSYVASITGCDFSTLTGKGIEVQGANGLTIQDTVLEGITGVALDIGTATYGFGVNLIDVHFESNTGTDLNLQSSGSYYSEATATGCTFVGTPSIALGQNSKLVIATPTNGGGGSNVCTISGSSTARATFLGGAPVNYTQSGTFDWHYTDNGTWTPAITFATLGNLNVVYATQVGRWTRTADEVLITGRITTSTFTWTTSAGALQITLPFTALNAAGLEGVGTVLFQGITKANYTQIVPLVDPNTAIMNFYGFGSGQAASEIVAADMPSGGTVALYFTIVIKVAG